MANGSFRSTSTSSPTGYVVSVSDGQTRNLSLAPRSVADFYEKLMAMLADLGIISARIHELPNEVPDPIRFRHDRLHASYHAD
jgi:hypothetical protein